jgi:hypothetical protein
MSASSGIGGIPVELSTTSGRPPFISRLTVGTTASTQAGDYAIVITAVSGGIIETVAPVLIVAPPAQTDGAMTMTSNSTISEFSASEGTLTFNAGGPPGTFGSATVVAPVGFFSNGTHVLVNGQAPATQPQVSQNSTYYTVQISYEQPSLITVGNNLPVPEFSRFFFAETVTLVALAVLLTRKRMRQRALVRSRSGRLR